MKRDTFGGIEADCLIRVQMAWRNCGDFNTSVLRLDHVIGCKGVRFREESGRSGQDCGVKSN